MSKKEISPKQQKQNSFNAINMQIMSMEMIGYTGVADKRLRASEEKPDLPEQEPQE